MKTRRIVVCLCLLLTVICAGCGGKEPADSSSAGAQEAPGDSLLESALEACLQEAVSETDPAFLTAMEERNSFEVLSVTESGDGTVKADLRVSAPDLLAAVAAVEGKMTGTETQEQILAAMDEAVRSAELAESRVTLTFTYTDGRWAPVLTDDFLDAYYGGVFQLRSQYLSGLVGEGGAGGE